MTGKRTQSGNVFALIFGAVALTGVLAAVSMQTLQGPVTTITRVTQRNIADTQMLMDARIIINGAIAGTAGGDADGDGIVEPAPFVAAAGGETPPANGGYLPINLGLSLTDPWGSKYGYCVWDHGTTNSSTDRINGDNTATASQQPVIAIIAAGPDKVFQTPCPTYGGSVMNVVRSGDDLVQKFTYAEASANSNGLWTLNESDQAKAELKDSGGTANVSIDRSTGIGDFLGITTDTISAKTAAISIGGGLKLDTESAVTDCAAPVDAGTMRYNSGTAKLEYCDGTAWKVAGGTPDATFITQTPSADLSAEQALSTLSTGIMKVTTATGVVTSGAVDLSGTEATGILAAGRFPALTGEVTTSEGSLVTTVADDILDFTEFKDAMTLDAPTDIAVTGANVLSITNTGTGNSFLVNDQAADTAPFVIDADGKVGIGTATPSIKLHVYEPTVLNRVARLEGDANALDFYATASYSGMGSLVVGKDLQLWVDNDTSKGLIIKSGGNVVIDTDTLFVDAAANEVGIGTTSPAAKLDVAGAIKLGSQAACDAGGANNGTVRYDSATKKFQLCVDGVWGSISSIDQLDDIGDVDAAAPTDKQVISWDDVSGTWQAKSIIDLGPAHFSPAGADKQVQFNDNGVFGVDADFTWDKTTNYLDLGTTSVVSASLLQLKTVTGNAPVAGPNSAGGSTGQVQFNVTGQLQGDSALVWDNTNKRLGIGTTAPTSPLHVSNGGITADAYGYGGVLILRRANGSAASPTGVASGENFSVWGGRGYTSGGAFSGNSALIYMQAEEAFTSSTNGSAIYFMTTPQGSTTPTEKMRITGSGDVGIGTTNPASSFRDSSGNQVTARLLDIQPGTALPGGIVVGSSGRVGAGSTNRQGYFLRRNDGWSTARSGMWKGSDTSGLEYWEHLVINNDGGDPAIYLAQNGASKVAIDGAGNVGIGTASPGGPLDVRASNTADGQSIAFFRRSDGQNAVVIGNAATATLAGTQVLTVGGSADGKSAVFNGTVYINTTSNATANALGRLNIIQDTGDAINIRSNAGNNNMINLWKSNGTGTMIAFYTGAGQTSVGSIASDASQTVYNTASDYRLKENIKPLTGGLASVLRLRPSRFDFITDPQHRTVDGFIAHEVQEVAPYAVTGEKDAVGANGKPVYQQLDYGKLTPLLTAAIQDLKADNDNLRAELSATKESFEKRLQALEAK